MCWLGDWIRLIHPMHWFQSLLRSSRRLKPQISHGFLAPFEGFPDASPGVLQVWENVGIQVIMGLRGSVEKWVRGRFAIFRRYEWASVVCRKAQVVQSLCPYIHGVSSLVETLAEYGR